MSDTIVDLQRSLTGLRANDWVDAIAEIVGPNGYVTPLGSRHIAAFKPQGKTLLVTFETQQGIQTFSPKSHPLGWKLVASKGWSNLALVSNGDTWFRDPAVYAFFDKYVDDGFFDAFDTVIFYGAGPCGYAAAAFSVVAPSALVLCIQPQATLAPHLSEWDRRFPEQRRLDFTNRYGYAPDMIDAAHRAYVVYDPAQIEDAMHATLFSGPNVTKLRAPHMGSSLQTDLLEMNVLFELIEQTEKNSLTPARFGRFLRARRTHLPYLRRLLAHLDASDRPDLAKMLCLHVTAHMKAPRFAHRLQGLADEGL